MLNDISLPAIAAVHPGSVPVTGRRTQAADLTQAVPPVTPVLNPTLRLDAALGLVVIEFRNDSGAITTSIPSQRQLQEYQRWQATKFGPGPARPKIEIAAKTGPDSDEAQVKQSDTLKPLNTLFNPTSQSAVVEV
jgi:hypothetical protein